MGWKTVDLTSKCWYFGSSFVLHRSPSEQQAMEEGLEWGTRLPLHWKKRGGEKNA